MTHYIQGFELYYDEETDTFLLCKKIDGKDRFLKIDITLGTSTYWFHVVQDDKEYEKYEGKKLQRKIKQELFNQLTKKND